MSCPPLSLYILNMYNNFDVSILNMVYSICWVCILVTMTKVLCITQRMFVIHFQSVDVCVFCASISPLIGLPAICFLHLYSNFISSLVLYINFMYSPHTPQSELPYLSSLGNKIPTHSLLASVKFWGFFLYCCQCIQVFSYRRKSETECTGDWEEKLRFSFKADRDVCGTKGDISTI